jgi:phage-related protein (TIGR01555 family)
MEPRAVKGQNIVDSFKNFIANLNTGRDKQAGGEYCLLTLTDTQWSVIYRTSWMGRKVVDIPAKDATRKWREWEADADQITLITAEEKRLQLPQKVKLALQQSRLFGGSGIYFSIADDDPELPLDLSTVKEGALDFVTVFPKGVLVAGDLELDPMSADYGLPQWYEVSGSESGQTKIHRSRLAIFTGNDILTPQELVGQNQGWGDSVLQSAYEAVRNADSTASNISSLVYEAKIDVLQIPDLSSIMDNPRHRELLVERVELSGQLKGNNGMLVIDKEEEYSQKTFQFAGLPEISYQALQAVSGAADIPITRFLGQSPAGLTSTGEADLKNYYDSVNSMQTLVVTPALRRLDDVLVRSALGVAPDDIAYEWASLWQMTDAEKSRISKETAETIEILVNTQLFPEDALSEASANLLVEHSILPGFELTGKLPDNERELEDGATILDATPKTLYVSRRVLNTKEIMAWARRQGIEQMLPASELHVTIMYSETPVDWLEMGEDWSSDARGQLRVKPGGARAFEEFEGGAKALQFVSNDLQWRHENMLASGAVWEHDGYSPHITITYGEAPDDVEPYQGPIVLGPERFEEIQHDNQNDIEEITL